MARQRKDRLRQAQSARCSLCGIALPVGMMVPDGGQACADIRWYCKDAKSCTDRWTARLPETGHVAPVPSAGELGPGAAPDPCQPVIPCQPSFLALPTRHRPTLLGSSLQLLDRCWHGGSPGAKGLAFGLGRRQARRGRQVSRRTLAVFSQYRMSCRRGHGPGRRSGSCPGLGVISVFVAFGNSKAPSNFAWHSRCSRPGAWLESR